MAARPPPSSSSSSSSLRASLGRAVHCVLPSAGGSGSVVGGKNNEVEYGGFARLDDETTEPLLLRSDTASKRSSSAALRSSAQPFCRARTGDIMGAHEGVGGRPVQNVDTSEPATVFCFLRGLSIPTIVREDAPPSPPSRTSGDAQARPPPPPPLPSPGPRPRPSQSPSPDRPGGAAFPTPLSGTRKQERWGVDENQPQRKQRGMSPAGCVNTASAPQGGWDSPTKSCMTFPVHYHRSLSEMLLAEESRRTNRGTRSVPTRPPPPTQRGKVAVESQRRPASLESDPIAEKQQPPRQKPRPLRGATPGAPTAPSPARRRRTGSATRTPQAGTGTSACEQKSPERVAVVVSGGATMPVTDGVRAGELSSRAKPPARRSTAAIDARALKSEPRLQASCRDVPNRRRVVAESAAATAAAAPDRGARRVSPQRPSRTQALQHRANKDPSPRRAHRGATTTGAAKRPLAAKAAPPAPVPKHVEFAAGAGSRRPRQPPRSPRSVTSTEAPTVTTTTELSMTQSSSHSSSTSSSSNGGTEEAPGRALAEGQWESFPATTATAAVANAPRGDLDGFDCGVFPCGATKGKASAAKQASWTIVSEPFGNDDFMSWDPNDFDFDEDDFFGVKVD